MKDERSRRINQLSEENKWDALIKVARKELEREPDNHWLLTQLASAYYEKRDYDAAYRFIVDAMYYQKDCPLVLWHLALIFRMLDRKDDAITIWQELIDRGEEKLADDECSEGLDWAKSLIADSKYMISKTYKELGAKDLAEDYKDAYLKDMQRGTTSIYDPDTL